MRTQTLNNRVRNFATFAAASMLFGCASNSQPRLDKEAHQLLRRGMEVTEAEGVMRNAHFSCGRYTIGYARSCTRVRNYAIFATCVQRINIASATSGQTVSRIDVPPPACGGM